MDKVVVHFDADGEVNFYVAGDATRLLIVDERAPNDRVYEWLSRSSQEEIDHIIGEGAVGSSKDARHAAISARILAALDGQSHLRPVK